MNSHRYCVLIIVFLAGCASIDFDYPRPRSRLRSRLSYWHTTMDTPDKCSALSLAKVGWVTLEWLQSLE